MKKARFDFLVKNKIQKKSNDIIIVKALVNKLIDNLYKPSMDVDNNNTFVTDRDKLKKYNLTEEPLNWGDLQCTEVIRKGNEYEVLIEEASPDCCHMLCEYIESYMKGWNWLVNVKTEW